MMEIIKNLSIKRSRANVEVIKLTVDYNTGNTMRIKYTGEHHPASEPYAIYYEAQPFTAQEYEERVKSNNEAIIASKKAKEKALAERNNKKKKQETLDSTETQ